MAGRILIITCILSVSPFCFSGFIYVFKKVPRMLANIEVATFQMKREIFGKTYSTPIVISPIGVQGQLHEEGDIGTALAASSLGIPYVHSSAASKPLEVVAEEADFTSGDDLGWFQLYWPIDDEVAISILQRAKKAGYKALVVTLDTWILGWRPSDLDTGYNPFLTGKGVGNVFSDPIFVKKYCEGKSPLSKDATEDDILAASIAAIGQLNPGVSRKWSDLPFLRKHWGDGPIILKGIQTITDASRAVEAGMDGIWVSNHGGRQVDGAIGSLQALIPIASYIKSIKNGPKIIFDSGIRSGADIMKALGEFFFHFLFFFRSPFFLCSLYLLLTLCALSSPQPWEQIWSVSEGHGPGVWR